MAKYKYLCTKTFVTPFLETAKSATVDNDVAVDGTTYVQIPAAGNGLATGWVLIAGSTNYDGIWYATAATNYIRIPVPPATYTAETFAGTETINQLTPPGTFLTFNAGKEYEFDAAQSRSEFTQITTERLTEIPVKLTDLRASDTAMALLGAAAGTPSGAMGITVGTHGSASPVVVGEAASGNSKTDTCRVLLEIPEAYQGNRTLKVRAHARVSVAATSSATVDCECYKTDGEAGVGSDLCETAAQSCNSATWADYDFTITQNNLAKLDILDIQFTAVVNDTGGTTGAVFQLGNVSLLLDI